MSGSRPTAAILTNPWYTGRQVWNRQRKDEVLLDVNDVAQGHVTKLRWNSQEEWVWSDGTVHTPIVSADEFMLAQQILAARGGRHTSQTRKRTPHIYQLRGLLFCAACSRRMQSHWINHAAYYRCRFPEEYALANKLSHPSNVYLREDRIVPRLDEWLGRLFEPECLDRTLDALAAAQCALSHEDAVQAEARRQIAERDRKHPRHPAALEAGADPAVVTGWIRDVQAARAEAEAQLRRLGHHRRGRWNGTSWRR